jgi:hypothetical protein
MSADRLAAPTLLKQGLTVHLARLLLDLLLALAPLVISG